MSPNKMLVVLALMLASCVCTTPPLPANLPEPPLSLIDNPPAFRLLNLEKLAPLTPVSVGSGENRR